MCVCVARGEGEIDCEFGNEKEENLRHQGGVMEDFLEEKLN